MRDTKPEYTARQGRRFGVTLAIAFAVVAAIAAWRSAERVAGVAGAVALVLAVMGLVLPKGLEQVERAWMGFAHAISRVTTPLFMGIVYFVVLTPAGVIRRTFGRNPLEHGAEHDSYWAARPRREPEAARLRMRRQF